MKRTTLLLLSLIAASTGAFAQTPDIDTPVLALPANLRANASVIKWKLDFTYDTLKKGTSNLVCFDKSGFPKQQAFMMECTVDGNLPRVAQNLKFEAMGEGAQAAFDAAEKDGTRVKPVFGSVWYHFMGPSREMARMHMTVAVPGATKQSLGLADNAKEANGTVWIMNAGTTTAHLMVPGE
jgi:hypothetical protein